MLGTPDDYGMLKATIIVCSWNFETKDHKILNKVGINMQGCGQTGKWHENKFLLHWDSVEALMCTSENSHPLLVHDTGYQP